jgi:mRNA-degrading endonuclease toxin of MazEF toxin-antitoxin module
VSVITLKHGHMYWARMDKRRPVLVLSPDYRNERANDVIIVPGSTTIREAPTHVVLRAGEGGVRARTTLKCEQVTTLPKDDLQPRAFGGKLSAERIAAVERALLRAVGVAVPEPE